MASVFLPAIYVPKPPPDQPWMGGPQRSYILRQLAHQKFFGAPGQAPTKAWHYDYDTEVKLWLGKPQPAFSLHVPLPPTPFFKLWRWDLDNSTQWLGTPQASAILTMLVEGGRPFPKSFWRYDYVPPPDWQMLPGFETSAIIQILVSGGRPFSKLWQWNYDPPPPWQMPNEWMNANTADIYNLAGEPFFREWRWDYDSDIKLWLGEPMPMPGPIFESVIGPPVTPKPIFNPYRDDIKTDTDLWLGTPRSSALLRMLTVGGKPFAKEWRSDILLDAPLWQWQPPGSDIVRLLTEATPFAKRNWRSDIVPPPDWGMPNFWMSSDINRILSANKPNHRLWQWNFDPPPFWLGQPVAPFVKRIPPPPINPRTQGQGLWAYHHQPTIPWTWVPLFPVVILPPAPPPIPFPRRYSVKNLFPPNLTYTVNNPNTSLPTPAATSPQVKVYVNEPATVYLGLFDIAPVEYQVTAASVQLQFIRPDGTFYYVVGSPYTYISMVNGYPYITYTSAVGEFNQIGWWTAVFSIGPAVSQQFAFYIYPPNKWAS